MNDTAIPDYIYKQREAKMLEFEVNHDAATEFTFQMKRRKSDSVPLVEVSNASIIKYHGTSIFVPLTPSNLDFTPGDYVAEIKSEFAADNVDKSEDLIVRIQQSILND